MEKNYLLLSNNKSSGPYSLEQLLQFSLKPTDLIWIANESVIWRNASEISELSEVVQRSVKTAAAPRPVVQANTSAVVTEVVPVQQPSPKKIYVSLPSGSRYQPTETKVSLEEKAEALKQKILNIAAQKNSGGDANQTTVIHHLPMAPDKPTNGYNRKKLLTSLRTLLSYAALVVVALVSSFYLFRRQPSKLTSSEPVVLFRTTSYTAAPELKPEPVANKTSETKAVQTKVSEPIATTETRQKTAAVNVVSVTPAVVKQPAPAEVKATVPALPTVTQTALRQKHSVMANTPVTALFETVSEEFKNDEGIGLSITFQNKSEQHIRAAIVDVFYYDATEKEIGKARLYFGKMAPKSFVTKTSPPKEGAFTSYRVDLVSSEKNGLYVHR